MKKLPCSAPLLTLNNYEALSSLLPFLVDHFEDVYLLDGNSTDGTIELARSLGIRVEKQFETLEPNQRISDFRAMRLRLWSLAKFDWLFTLDSDERVTPACLQAVKQVVEEDKRGEAHSFCLWAQYPDGRIVEEAFTYPNRYIKLFRRSDGLTLVERKLHERFIIPKGVRTVLHNEGITSIWLPPKEYLEKTLRYVKIESESQFPPSVSYWLRWILYYNLRSFFGQSWRAIYTYARAIIYRRVALPLPYTAILLWYRWAVLGAQTYAWWRGRRKTFFQQ